MDKIVIEGGTDYDGEWEFEFAHLNHDELHRLKKLTGLRAGELMDALAALDTDLFFGLSVIVLEQHGKRVNEDVLRKTHIGAIRLMLGDEEEVEQDPTTPEMSEPPAEPRTSSGDATPDASAPQENGLSPTGPPDSPRSAISAQEISAA